VKIGILGGGQLGRMTALAGYPLGMRFRCFDTAEGPASEVAEFCRGSFEDQAALDEFAQGLDLVTYEFENVPVAAAARLQRRIPVWPPPRALEVSQDRLSEKTLFRELGIETPAFRAVASLEELRAAVANLGLPVVVKTRRMGYDGKGQAVIRSHAEVDGAWTALAPAPLIVESFVPFDRELSTIAVRSVAGETCYYTPVQNVHRGGILRTSVAPAPGTERVRAKAEAAAGQILESLGYVGVLAIEWFQVGDHLLANEMAPRVHNSGHWTMDGAETSQFENHLRAVSGMPLGSTSARGFSAMVNLIGTVPATADVLRVPGAHLHLYGKEPRPGRKLGHINVCCGTSNERDQLSADIARLVDDSR
jgi:5-(carboxyamino)imidazole ribonucleotide synthase